MGAERQKSRMPPLGALLVIIAFVVLVPFYHWGYVDIRNWQTGGSPAAELDGPYFLAIVAFRTVGAMTLAGLLLAVRRPSAIWVTIVAAWLAGPPLTFLFTGILMLSITGGQTSLPPGWNPVFWSAVFPLLVTVCLLLPRRVREHYGI
jgi:hypothetical protein